MTSLRVHPEVEDEIGKATEWYRMHSIDESVARDFNREVAAALKAAKLYPMDGTVYLRRSRRLFLSRFPYFLVYRIREAEIQVLALAHAKRRPGYWQKRRLS